MRTSKLSLSLFILSLLTCPAQAALKVDFDPDVDRRDILTAGAASWKIAEGNQASRQFGEITVTLHAVDGSITAEWWRRGYDFRSTFVSDGIYVRGKALEMRITGLTPGKHTIVTYHNALLDRQPGPLRIVVNGQSALRDVQPTHQATSEDDTATACVEVAAEAGKDVVLRFEPEDAGNSQGLVLNGFAIDITDPARRAIKPIPSTGDEHAPENPLLTWTPAKAAVRHQLYFGTNRDAVTNATRASSEFKTELTSPSFETSGLNPFDTYFWRVDTIDANNQITRGDVWSFRVRRLAFPGAEGYGRFAIGGRGGRVIEVTNLNDSGPGSLREAVNAEGPRTIVFRVGGTIHLKSRLIVNKPYCTIAGQTAPSEGIAVRGYTFGAGGTHDVIIRYMRIRIGDESGRTNDGAGLGYCDHSIMDHCSIAWSIDEGFSSRGARNITLQRSIIAEPLNMSIHSHYVGSGKGHSFAGSISGEIGSFHHNLLANCAGRNWSLAGGLTRGGKYAGYLDIRNNVVYNWHHRTNDGGVKALNLIGNYYIPGPATRVFHLLMPDAGAPNDPQQYFMADNIMENRSEYDADNWASGGFVPTAGFNMQLNRLAEPFCESHITGHTARQAYDSVLADVGANWPKLDAIDERTINDVRNRTTTFKGSKTGLPGIIDSQRDVGDYPDLKGGEAPADTDHDGMPDAWESANGLNPADPSDGPKDSGDGYTNLERYLNSIPLTSQQ